MSNKGNTTMAVWNVIETAPKGERLDLYAKRWDHKTDSFEYKRFTDCIWRSTHFMNLEAGWRATHWMLAPPPPAIVFGGTTTEKAA